MKKNSTPVMCLTLMLALRVSKRRERPKSSCHPEALPLLQNMEVPSAGAQRSKRLGKRAGLTLAIQRELILLKLSFLCQGTSRCLSKGQESPNLSKNESSKEKLPQKSPLRRTP